MLTEIRRTAGHTAMPITGLVRPLTEDDRAGFADHLKRLDYADRHERFNASVRDEAIDRYAENALTGDSLSYGYVENGVIRGACELRPGGVPDLYEADLAFSIEPDWKRRGIGSRLLGRALRVAGERGFGRIGFTTDPQNDGMKALAHKFGATLQFLDGQTVGVFAPESSAVSSH